jgi:N-acetylmuramoyl-L-alanine amidase
MVHTVQQGEFMAVIAKRYGFTDSRVVYRHPENNDLRRRRPNPDVLAPGDEVFIPAKELRLEAGDTERTHRFRLNGEPLVLRVVIRDSGGSALKNTAYVLQIGPRSAEGTTDGDGMLEERISAAEETETVHLHLKEIGTALPLRIGWLDPIADAPAGVGSEGLRARLHNLGFPCGGEGDEDGMSTAVRAYQHRTFGSQRATGEVDSATRDALIKEHGDRSLA